MYTLCIKKDLVHAHKLTNVSESGLPFEKIPAQKSEGVLICAYDRWGTENGEDASLIVCETREDIQRLYDARSRGFAKNIDWYLAPQPHFIHNPSDPKDRIVTLTPSTQLAEEDPDLYDKITSKFSQGRKLTL